MSLFLNYLKSSIGKKQIVAVTGLMLIVFVLGHLAGNLLILIGPAAYNGYANKLSSLRPGLYLVEFALAGVFLIHMLVTYWLVLENIRARPVGYNVYQASGERSLATRLMPYTGTIIIIFIVSHLLDFTFANHEGPSSILNDGKNYGLYGLVYNTFLSIPHSMFYIVAMMCLGLHLTHGIHSVWQTFGMEENLTVKRLSSGLGFGIAILYSSIPAYVLLRNYLH